MTLVVSVIGPQSIWVMVDRRLSGDHRVLRDDAGKLAFLGTTVGVGILAYAGLGCTARGTEPSQWMSAVLRGRNLPFEHSLAILAEAMKREIPPHLLALPQTLSRAHAIVVPAIVENEPRLYTIELEMQGAREFRFRHTRWVVNPEASRPPRIALAGSGALYLQRHRNWHRSILRMISAYDDKRAQPSAVADQFARLCSEVSSNTADGTVGARSIIACRHVPTGVHGGGGDHWFYSGTARDGTTSSLPTIAVGMDVTALVGVLMPHFLEHAERWSKGETATIEFNVPNVDAELAAIPDSPDETLY